MKLYLFFLLTITLLFYSCDTIDDLDKIAGFGDIGFVIINPKPESFQRTGEDCLIRWKLEQSKGEKIKIELLQDKEIVQTISSVTENDGEYLWKNTEGVTGEKCFLRLTIAEGVYCGKYSENSFTFVKYPPGFFWFEPAELQVEDGGYFTMELHFNSGNRNLGAYGINICYDPLIIELCNWQYFSVIPGNDGFLTTYSLYMPGFLIISGTDVSGKGPSFDQHLITIFLYSVDIGHTDINIYIRDLCGVDLIPIENPVGIEAEVTVY